jgi:hypothetical protein
MRGRCTLEQSAYDLAAFLLMLLLGFSQGACLTAEFAVRHAGRYGGLIVFSGGLIGPPGSTWDVAGDFAGTPVFLGCSDVDAHVVPDVPATVGGDSGYCCRLGEDSMADSGTSVAGAAAVADRVEAACDFERVLGRGVELRGVVADDIILYSFHKNEEITIFQSQFFVGPIPVSLELLGTMDYGATISGRLMISSMSFRYRPGMMWRGRKSSHSIFSKASLISPESIGNIYGIRSAAQVSDFSYT